MSCKAFPNIADDLAPAFCAKMHRKGDTPCNACDIGISAARTEAENIRSNINQIVGRSLKGERDQIREGGTMKKKLNCKTHGEYEGLRSDSPCPKCEEEKHEKKKQPRAETRIPQRKASLKKRATSTDTDVLEALVDAGYVQPEQVEFARRLLGVRAVS